MFTKQFGLEIEFTGISREKAAETVAHYLGGTATITGDYYDTQKITTPDGRIWKLMYDGSINCQKKDGRRTVSAGSNYSVELVSPILSYRKDIDMIQALARRLRKAGGFANKSCGIHIHLDGASHTPRSIRNFVNIIYAHNDLLYKALQIAPERMRYGRLSGRTDEPGEAKNAKANRINLVRELLRQPQRSLSPEPLSLS